MKVNYRTLWAFIPEYPSVYILRTEAFFNQNTMIKCRVFNVVIIILSNVLMNTDIKLSDLKIQGITDIKLEDLKLEKSKNKKVKLI